MLHFVLQTLFLIALAGARIRNVKISRGTKLDTPGSNLVIFENEIQFMRDPQDSHYYFVIAKDYESSFVALRVTQTVENNKVNILEFERVNSFPNEFNSQTASKLDNVMFFKIKLEDTLNKQTIDVAEFHKGRMEPYPKVIRVYEKQKVETFDSKYPLSLYPTSETLNTYIMKVNDIHYKSEEPSDEYDDRITYGPYKNVAPLTFSQIKLMYTYAYPLPQFSEAKRDIYVSHWGNVAIDEYYNIKNEAAGINGQFSRVDYQPHINPNHGANAITSIDTTLPFYVNGLYYYDYIGNISSSNAERKDSGVDFNIQFRFPLFGQWKTDFNMGYNMPSQYHVFQDKKDSTKHTLEVNLMHAFEDSLTEDYTVKVILPEGATNIDVEVPQHLKNFADKIYLDKYFGTLDYFGRPMIVIKQSNAVYQLQDEILRVNYKFDNGTYLYLEPLCVFGMIFSLYVFAMIYSRLSLDLKNKDQLKAEHAKTE